MKKLVAFLVMMVMAAAMLAGCGNPVYDDFENFLNVEMAEVNGNYEKITAEAGTWETLEEDADIMKSLSEVLIPLVDDSLKKLEAINPATEEVKALKDKYVKVMDAYKKGFEFVLEGFNTESEDTINAGNDSINAGIALLDEYNAALEELAKEVGAEIEY